MTEKSTWSSHGIDQDFVAAVIFVIKNILEGHPSFVFYLGRSHTKSINSGQKCICLKAFCGLEKASSPPLFLDEIKAKAEFQ